MTKEIVHQSNCVDTSQQNRVVERKNRHLEEVMRALMYESKLPLSFWGDVVQCAAFLINKMHISILLNMSLYEILFDKPPKYDMLKPFGCLYYASTLKRERMKLDPKANPCIFIGYAKSQKGFKLYDLKTKIMFVSRDVRFPEKLFPYFIKNQGTHPLSQFFLRKSSSHNINKSNMIPCNEDVVTSEGTQQTSDT